MRPDHGPVRRDLQACASPFVMAGVPATSSAALPGLSGCYGVLTAVGDQFLGCVPVNHPAIIKLMVPINDTPSLGKASTSVPAGSCSQLVVKRSWSGSSLAGSRDERVSMPQGKTCLCYDTNGGHGASQCWECVWFLWPSDARCPSLLFERSSSLHGDRVP